MAVTLLANRLVITNTSIIAINQAASQNKSHIQRQQNKQEFLEDILLWNAQRLCVFT